MKYLKLLQFELKNIIKDKMSVFMLLYPIFIVVLMGIILPLSTKGLTQMEVATTFPIIFLMILCVGPMMGGMLMGFSILENKDEKTLNTIAVTPVSLKGYLLFKTVYCSVISLLGNFVLIYGIQLLAGNYYITFEPQTFEFISIFQLLDFGKIFAFSIASSMLTATVGLLLGGLAKNKVEGLIMMKTGGLVLILPALSLLNTFSGSMQYALGILPNFWCIKAMQNLILFDQSSANLPFYGYLLIAIIYTIFISFICYKVFSKKLQITT